MMNARYLLFGFLLLALFSSAYATITIASPVERTVPDGDVVLLGQVQPGETFDLIVSRYAVGVSNKAWSDFTFNWPVGWKSIIVEQRNNPNTIWYQVSVPQEATAGTINVMVQSTPLQDNVSEQITLVIKVSDSLVQADVDNLRQQTVVDQPISFRARVRNNSIAKTDLIVYSNLPALWYRPVTVQLPPNSEQEVVLTVKPGAYGTKPVSFSVERTNTRVREEGRLVAQFNGEMIVTPTLKSKFTSALSGFPFFTPSLSPYYLINGFLSLLG